MNRGKHVIDANPIAGDDALVAADDAHLTVILAFDGMQSLDAVGPAEVFAGASQLLRQSSDDPGTATGSGSPEHRGVGYDVRIVSVDGGPVRTESAVRLDTDPLERLPNTPIDTLVLPGGFAVNELRNDGAFVTVVADLIDRCGRLATVCTGAYLAAAAGALDGHRVTTHWARADRLAVLHPECKVDADPIYVHSPGEARDVWSSAGVTAGIDLSLGLVERDHSTDLAQEVARWLVMYLRRPGGQSQFAAPTWIRQAEPGPVRTAQQRVIDEPGADHRVATLARSVAMSERHFVRRFTEQVGVGPARFVSLIRLDAARQELERSPDSAACIARRCGFGSAETMRRTFQRHLGVSPDAYRRRFTHAAATS